MVSIIVPAYNEAENIKELLARIGKSFAEAEYEIVVIDDHSVDGTWEILKAEKSKYPLSVFRKQGKQGKAYSLVEGFEKAQGEILTMIDADLQYPPEAIPHMVSQLRDTDVVVANRKVYQAPKFRKVASRLFRYLFGKVLFGLDADIQSGLKVFKREVYETVRFYPKSVWAFDLEFLSRAAESGCKIGNFDIVFAPRAKGSSKIAFLASGWELTVSAVAIAVRKIKPIDLPSVDG